MRTIERPAPVGTDTDGQPVFDHEEVALYREARGVDQAKLAYELRVTQGAIAHYETGRRTLKSLTALRILEYIDRIADRRERMAAKGEARLNLLRTFCRADVTQGTQLERCGRPTEPGLVVCFAHIEQHEKLVGQETAKWIKRMARAEKKREASR